MEQMENNVVNVTVGNSLPTEIIEGNKKDLPKFTLSRGERFNVGLQELRALCRLYYETVSEMKEGAAFATPELKSKMESALDLTFDEEIEKLRLKNARPFSVERQRQLMLNSTLTPCTWRNWWWIFKVHRNEAQILLEESVRREAAIDIKNQADSLPTLPTEEEGKDTLSFFVALETLKEYMPRTRKKHREVFNTLIEQLAVGYESKSAELKRTAEELEEVKGQFGKAQERISELTEQVETLTEALIEDSEPDEEGTQKEEKEGKTEAAGEKVPEESEEADGTEETPEAPDDGESGEEEPTETADGDEEDDLYYGELDDSDE